MEIIELNALRIGNYHKRIESKGYIDEKLTLETLSRIFSDDLNISFNDFLNIDLTENWILNFGFKRIISDKVSSKEEIRFGNGGVYHIVKLNCKNPLWSFQLDFRNIKTIKYVHDFQNLYFTLTNMELTLRESSS